MNEKAEKLNGKAGMLGMFALLGAYYFTCKILPGISKENLGLNYLGLE